MRRSVRMQVMACPACMRPRTVRRQALEGEWRARGPYDGLLGFSNGAAAAFLLACHAHERPVRVGLGAQGPIGPWGPWCCSIVHDQPPVWGRVHHCIGTFWRLPTYMHLLGNVPACGSKNSACWQRGRARQHEWVQGGPQAGRLRAPHAREAAGRLGGLGAAVQGLASAEASRGPGRVAASACVCWGRRITALPDGALLVRNPGPRQLLISCIPREFQG